MRLGRSLGALPRMLAAGLLAALGWTALAAAAPAEPAGPAATPAPPAAAPAPRHPLLLTRPAAGGLVVGIDRETGLLVLPEPETLAKLLAARETAARRSRPAPVYHANGVISLDVSSWMREFLIAGVDAKGRPTFRCVSGPEAAAKALGRPTAPSSLEDR